MILQSLYELYDRLSRDPEYNIPPPGYSLQRISFKVVIKPDGTLYNIEDARMAVGKKFVSIPVIVPGSTKTSGSGFNPCFLWDNTGYLLGYKTAEKDRERARESFQSFRNKHMVLESAISASFSALGHLKKLQTTQYSRKSVQGSVFFKSLDKRVMFMKSQLLRIGGINSIQLVQMPLSDSA
jgi:hypothetical protein